MKIRLESQADLATATLWVGESFLQHPGATNQQKLEERVHQTRVRIKELKAWTRLLKAAGVAESESLLNRLRDLGRRLAPWRDRLTLAEALECFEPHHQNATLSLGAGEKNEAAKALSKIERELIKVTVETKNLFMRGKIPSQRLFRAIHQSIERCRKAYKQCSEKPNQARHHRLRKRTKDLLYQLRLLKPFLAKPPKKALRKLKRSAKSLGRGHDWHLLNDWGRQHPGLLHVKPSKIKKSAKKQDHAGRDIAGKLFSKSSRLSVQILTPSQPALQER